MGTGVSSKEDRTEFEAPTIVVRNGRLVILKWETMDSDTVSFFESQPEGDRPAVLERVVRIGVEASRTAGTIEGIDYVERVVREIFDTSRHAPRPIQESNRSGKTVDSEIEQWSELEGFLHHLP